jgi:hypothetical protein
LSHSTGFKTKCIGHSRDQAAPLFDELPNLASRPSLAILDKKEEEEEEERTTQQFRCARRSL